MISSEKISAILYRKESEKVLVDVARLIQAEIETSDTLL